MKRRILALILAAAFILSMSLLLTACKEEEAGEDSETTTAAEGDSSAADTTTKAGDTTKAETTTAAETTTEAVKDKIVFIEFFEDDGSGHSPWSLMTEGSSVAAKFTIKEGFLESLTITCPSWSNDIGNLTIKLYKWDTDYEKTVAGTPVAEEKFVDYADNAELTLMFEGDKAKTIGAGDYIWWLGDGVDESASGVGLWYFNAIPEDDALGATYVNGVEEAHGWQASATVIIPAA